MGDQLKPGRVAVMIDRLRVGGVEKTAAEEVRTLRELGVDATLLVLKRDRNVPATVSEWVQGIPVDHLDDRLARVLRRSWPMPGFYFFSVFHLLYAVLLPMRVRRREWDVIIAHNSFTAITAWTLSKFRSIPYCMFVWDPVDSVLARAYTSGPIRRLRPVLRPLGRAVDGLLARRARRIIMGSRSYVPYVSELVALELIVVAPPGCHPVSVPRSAAGDFVLAATSWKEGKQLEVLLRAAARIPAARLVVAGRWLHEAYRARIEALCADLDLGKRVEFRGELTEVQMADLRSTALCAVTLNAELGFGMPALEAAGQSCTFLCPPVAGIASFFEDGVEAFYFDEGDTDGLARILERLIQEPRLALSAGVAAWERARSQFTWRHHAEAVLAAAGTSGSRATLPAGG